VSEEELFIRISVIVDKVHRLNRENPTGPDEPTDPRIVKLLDEAGIITKQLDPLMRERYRDNPAKLAEWDEIIHSCY
jgi:hypothetical protein